MNDGVLKLRDKGFDRAILLARDLPERASIALFGWEADSLIEHMRRHAVRVGHIRHAHPRVDRLVSMIVPVDGAANRAKSEKPCEEEGRQKQNSQEPLMPFELFHFECARLVKTTVASR